jgi:hypothetical protein
MNTSLTGNCDNVLFTGERDHFGFAAIDSHLKLIRGITDTEARERSEVLLRKELGGLITEKPSRSFDWLRFTVDVVSGHSLSDEALECARCGAIRAIAAVPSAIKCARAELDEAREKISDKKWKKEIERVDEDALVHMGDIAVGWVEKYYEVLTGLPVEPGRRGDIEREEEGEAIHSNLLESARLIGADPKLWGALSDGLRRALINERVHKLPLGEHSTGDFWHEDPMEK